MASIPLPALHTAPIAPPPNMLQMYGQMMGIKNAQQEMQQRQVMAPLEQQQAQQQVQGGGLDLQQRQLALNDQKALSATMQQWGKGTPSAGAGVAQASTASPDGASAAAGAPTPGEGGAASSSALPSYDDLIPLAIKNGASFQAVQGLQSHILDMKSKASTIAKDDAQAGSANVAAIKAKNGMIGDAMSGVMQLPDAQLPQGILSAAQELYGKGVIDQQHMQTAQQLARLAQTDPTQARQQLNIQNLSLGAYSNELENQQKQLTNQKGQQEQDWRNQNGAPAGVTPDEMALAAYLKGNPGKTPADYALWKMHNSPMAVVMGNQFTPGATDLAAQNLLQTGTGPQGMYRSPGTTAAVYNKAAEMNAGGPGIAANKATYQADAGSLRKLQTNYDQVQAFEATAQKNMDLLQQTAQKIPDLGTRYANIPVRMISGSMIGSDNMAAFKTALTTAQTEAAKVLNSSNATGVLSDSARHELQDVIDGNVPYSALVSSLNTLKQDMGNRTQAYRQQIQEIQGRLKGAGQPQGSMQFARDPQGRLHQAPAGMPLPPGWKAGKE